MHKHISFFCFHLRLHTSHAPLHSREFHWISSPLSKSVYSYCTFFPHGLLLNEPMLWTVDRMIGHCAGKCNNLQPKLHDQAHLRQWQAACMPECQTQSQFQCHVLCVAGEGEIRMAWGSTQEASALFSVMHLFPDSQLEEVGLCWVDPKTQIPPEWGFRTEDLPPLGASPDGLIRHRAKAPPLPPTALPSPNGLLHKQASHRDMSHNRHMPLNQAPASNAEASTQAQPASSSGRSQEAFSSATQNSSAQSQSSATHSTVSTPRAALCASAQPNDPSLSEFESLPAKLEISSNNLTDRASNRSAHSNGVVASVAAGPPLSSDAGVPSASAAPAPQVAHGPSASAADALSASATAATEPNRATPPEQAKNQEEWLEAVEIKNVCPFREVREVSSNGKARRLYRLSDPGPYTRVCIPYAVVSLHVPHACVAIS